MDLSYESSNNSTIDKKKSSYPILNLRRNIISKSLRKTTFSSYIKDNSSKEKENNEDEESEEEDEQAKKLRKREEYKDFLIKLLTESPKHKYKKNKSKLKPLNRSKISLDKTLSIKSHTTTLPTLESIPKYLTEKERKKLISKIKREQRKREKEKEKKENQKILKEIKLKQSQNKEIFRSNLNRLYGYNKKFLFYNAKLKREKCNSLEKYQEDILRVSSINISKDNLLKLFSDLKSIKLNSEQTKPLPPINFKALVRHSLDENDRKKKWGYRAQSKKFSEMDEYEKEMYLIKTNSRHEKMNVNNNKFLYKMYEILPEHVVETIYAKKRKF